MKKLLTFLIFFTIVETLLGQQYPVTIVPRVNSPAPVNFYNYADDTSLNSPVTIQIFLNDITISNRQIRLKTYFEGGNINFRSKDFVVGANDLFIEGGVPLSLTNVDLAPYYKFENIEGINSTTYAQTIPEGSYNFCFEVYDYLSGTKLSDKRCATVFIFKNEPPILNIPFNNSNIEPRDFENIIFQWTPRHINVSNVEYEFSMVEIWDDHINPQTAFLSQVPVYEETTRRTTLIYGPDKPLLLPGKRYAWRVRAKALQGLEEIGLFKNQGYSEVFWFSRTLPCETPEGVSGEPKGTSKINVYWNQNPELHSEYIIAYREADRANAYWFTKRTNSSWATIWNLKPGTTYEYKVKGKCQFQYSDYSEIQRVTTETVQNDDANYQCGIVPDAIAISNRDPHPGLILGDVFTAGKFRITITEIQNQTSGRITGRGYVEIPYLKFAKFGVEFKNVLVNTSNQLAEGEVVTLYDAEFGQGSSATVDVDISDGINGDDGILEDAIEVDFVIDTIEIDSNGAIVVTGTNGESAIVPGDDDINIVSANGDVWSVGEDGTITKQDGADGGAVVDSNTDGVDDDGNVTEVSADGVKVTFENSGYYYFDELPEGTSAVFEKEYKILQNGNNKYKVAYKAISNSNGDDFVRAKVEISDSDITKEDIIFKTKDGAKLNVNWLDDETVRINLERKYHYVDEEILAVVKSKNDSERFEIAGSLIVTHLASEKLDVINVTLVPVGIPSVDEQVKIGVKEIYKKAGVRLNIQEVPSVDLDQIYGWDSNNDTRLKVGDSSMLSHYTDEEKGFNNYVKKQNYYSKTTYYVFVTNVPVTDSEVAGFMPLKRQFGFVFTRNANTIQQQSRTLAHELGHGVFGLEHTWDEYKFPPGATDFLMDYGSGTVLNHLDWKKIHAPGMKLYWFQGDDDGQNIVLGINYQVLVNWLKENNGKSSVDYDPKLFLSDSFRTIMRERIPISVNFKIDNRQLNLGGYLSNKKGKVDLINLERLLELEINKKHFYTDKIKYAVGDEQSGKDAISLRIADVKDYEEYSNYVGLTVDKDYIIDEFNKEFEKAGSDCNKLDYLYEHAPNFVVDSRNIKLWDDLISLTSCSINEWGTDEEKAVIKLIEGIGRNNAQDLVDGLLSRKIDGETLFRVLYGKIHNYGGDDNFSKFIKKIYAYWLNSSYANEEIQLFIPYSSKKKLGFYTSNFKVFSKTNGKEIFITSKYNGSNYEAVGSFHFYDKIDLINSNQDAEGLRLPSQEIPAFYLLALKDVNETSNLETAFSLTLDVAATFTGAGNIAKLRHLRHLTTAQKSLKYSIAGAEISSGVLNAMLTLSDCNTEFCNKLRTHLFWLEMGSLGLDTFTEQMIRKTAKEAYDIADASIDVTIRDELAKVAKVQVSIKDKIKQLFKGNINLAGDKVPVVKGYINNNDNYVDIIVHSDDAGDNFSVIIELEGRTENVTLTASEFAQALQSIPNDKTIRLLSCNKPSSASEIAQILNRDVIGSTGEMKIYSNKVIEGDHWYVAKPDGQVNDITMNTGVPSGSFVVLKQKFVDNLPADVLAKTRNVLGDQYDEFIEMLTRSNLPGTWTIKSVGNALQVVDRKGTVWATISDKKIDAKIGGTGDGWNPLLNVDPPLMKGFTYKVQGGRFEYKIDGQGRVVKAIMNPVEINGNIRRNEAAQRRAKDVKDGSSQNVDDGGHIFRNEWGGPSEQINYFPQNSNENSSGAWFQMEKAVSDMLKSDSPPNVKIEMDFNYPGNSKRPNSVDVKVTIDNEIDISLSDNYKNPL